MNYEPVFPAELEAIASKLLPSLAVGEQWPPRQGFVVRVQSQTLSAPSRVYYSPDRLRTTIQTSNGEARILALCLGTRHANGFVREECVRELVEIDRPWVVPFVVQLLGEYVIQIVHVIAAALPCVNQATYGGFVRENPEFIATAKRRAISYWNCYYRAPYTRLSEYPGLLALEEIEKIR